MIETKELTANQCPCRMVSFNNVPIKPIKLPFVGDSNS